MCCPLKQAIKDKTSFGLLTFFISMDWRNLMEKPIHKMWLWKLIKLLNAVFNGFFLQYEICLCNIHFFNENWHPSLWYQGQEIGKLKHWKVILLILILKVLSNFYCKLILNCQDPPKS